MSLKKVKRLTLSKETLNTVAGAVVHRTTFRCHESLYTCFTECETMCFSCPQHPSCAIC